MRHLLSRMQARILALAACLSLLAQVAVPAAGPATKTPTEFRWSYLPSFGAIRFVIVDPPAGATHWTVELSSQRDRAFLNKTIGTLPTKKAGETWMVGELGAGRYTLAFQLGTLDKWHAGELKVLAQHTEGFNRTIAPFENLGLGEEDVIVPPFSAINTMAFSQHNVTAGRSINNGDELGFIKPGRVPTPNARTYTLGPAGLLSQITVTPQPNPRDNCTW